MARRKDLTGSRTDAESCVDNIANKIRATSQLSTTMLKRLKRVEGELDVCDAKEVSDAAIKQFCWEWLDYCHNPETRSLNIEKKIAKLESFANDLVKAANQRTEAALRKAAR